MDNIPNSRIDAIYARWLNGYDYLTLHRVPGPRSITYFLPICITFSALMISPSKLSVASLRYVILPAVLVLQGYIWTNHHSFDVVSMQTTLTSFALLGWYDVRRTFKHIERVKPGLREVSYPKNIYRRLQWLGTLFASLQFTDFLIQNAAHDLKQRNRKPVSAFAQYLWRTTIKALFSFCLLDVTSYLLQDTSLFPCLTTIGHACPDSLQSLATDGLLGFIHVYAAASFALAHFPTLVILLAIAPFPELRYHPSISPVVLDNLFGLISSIWQIHQRTWGLRAFWGIFWHQNLRYVTITPGLALVRFLRIPRHSLAWYTVVTWQAFFWSGCIHAGMVPPYPLHTDWSSTALRFRLATFFWLQPLGILIEGLIDTVRRTKPNNGNEGTHIFSVYQLLAFLWASTFILVTLWATVLPVGRELGWWLLHPVPFSVTKLIVQELKQVA